MHPTRYRMTKNHITFAWTKSMLMMLFKISTKNYHTFSDEASITSSSSSTTSSHKYLVTNQNSNSIMKSTGSKSDLQKSEQVFVPPDGGFQVRNS